MGFIQSTSLFRGVILILLCCFVISYQSPLLRVKKPRESRIKVFTEDSIVEETDSLLEDGETLTRLDPTMRDIVLVIGNTGAGKTTITKFLAEVEKLEAYDAGDRYLIRDKDRKISENSTMVSKTIFPDLITDPETNTVFYDLPGFSDTRSASIEIANACFMKKVADHANRVKLLFIVNYGSLRSGESRTDFKTFLEHATDLIKSPSKFKSSIALVATKVEVSLKRQKIIQGIANYLEMAKSNLAQVISDETKRQAAKELIDALLLKDSSGNYSRISYFKQPDDEGPLTDFPLVMEQKSNIENMLHNNIDYTPKSPTDFGFSVSPAAKLIITKLVEKTNKKITSTTVSIAKKLGSHFEDKVKASPWTSIGSLIKEHEMYQVIATALNSAKNLQEFRQSLHEITSRSQITDAISEESAELSRRQNNLAFLEEISGTISPATVLDWSKSVQEAVKNFGMAVSKKAVDFGKHVEMLVSEIASQIEGNFMVKLTQLTTSQDKLKEYEKITSSLNNAGSSLSAANSVNGFIQRVQLQVNLIDANVPTQTLVELTDDLKFAPEVPIQPLKWVMPFEKLLTKFREGKYNTNLQVLEDSNEKDKAERDAEMKRMRDQFEEEKKDQENRMNKMREQFEEDNQRRAYELSEVKRAHTEEMGRMQGMISDLRTQISDQESSNVVSSFFNLVGTIGSALINRESNKSFDR